MQTADAGSLPSERTPAICIRQELSVAVQISARVSSKHVNLSESMAADTSGFLTANVPPNPQHCSASGNSISRSPRTLRNNCSGLSPTCSDRSEWQDGCSVTVCGKNAPTSVSRSLSTSSSLNSKIRGIKSSTALISSGSADCAAIFG